MADITLRQVAAALRGEDLAAALGYARDWNASGRTCGAAQALLGAVFREHSAKELATLPGAAGALEALEAYSRRHYARADRLLRSTFLADFVLGMHGALAPDGEGDEEEGPAPAVALLEDVPEAAAAREEVRPCGRPLKAPGGARAASPRRGAGLLAALDACAAAPPTPTCAAPAAELSASDALLLLLRGRRRGAR